MADKRKDKNNLLDEDGQYDTPGTGAAVVRGIEKVKSGFGGIKQSLRGGAQTALRAIGAKDPKEEKLKALRKQATGAASSMKAQQDQHRAESGIQTFQTGSPEDIADRDSTDEEQVTIKLGALRRLKQAAAQRQR